MEVMDGGQGGGEKDGNSGWIRKAALTACIVTTVEKVVSRKGLCS